MTKDCDNFVIDARDLLGEYLKSYDSAHAGHDFWLTRNRHGAGFWDRGLGKLGDKLTEIAQRFGEFSLYIAHDGKLHQASVRTAQEEEEQLELGLPEPEQPEETKIIFKTTQSGCYADGANGDRHRQDVLAGLLRTCGETKLSEELDDLSVEEDEDKREFAYEAEDEAIEALNRHTEEGVNWEIYEGDLCLRPSYDDDE